jgi:hypothetical protein
MLGRPARSMQLPPVGSWSPIISAHSAAAIMPPAPSYRDGLMVAPLAFAPPRRKNVALRFRTRVR